MCRNRKNLMPMNPVRNQNIFRKSLFCGSGWFIACSFTQNNASPVDVLLRFQGSIINYT